MPEELGVGHRGVVEGHVVVHGPVEVLSGGGVAHRVVLRALDIEVRDPTQLSINVSILGYKGVVRHSSPLELVHLVGVRLALWVEENGLLTLEALVEVFLVVGVVAEVEERRTVVVSTVPLVLARRQHAVIGILLHYHLGCCVCVDWIGPSHLGMGAEDVGESPPPKRGEAVDGSHRGSEFWVNYNVFGVRHY